ncbi:uncharacterized protein EI90DRAFT_3012932 [Cantharellus anzutake]|uniref:uncharacterized protein n=1 Tax=Cantharellus anzutake TaxID=1750568 RepID=UPI001905DE75|nr:uncharacterized protein EI90DRAFT_3012932 [Cantharellus anzutake]KAF8338752.1 hypothetical protein EI90DRAFT_3012932 [Cantharellus anzutake]
MASSDFDLWMYSSSTRLRDITPTMWFSPCLSMGIAIEGDSFKQNFETNKAWLGFIEHEGSGVPHVHVCLQRATPVMRITFHFAHFQIGMPVFTLRSGISEKRNVNNVEIAE